METKEEKVSVKLIKGKYQYKRQLGIYSLAKKIIAHGKIDDYIHTSIEEPYRDIILSNLTPGDTHYIILGSDK